MKQVLVLILIIVFHEAVYSQLTDDKLVLSILYQSGNFGGNKFTKYNQFETL